MKKYYLFTLGMPHNNSWNGKWSGSERLYCIVRSYTVYKRGESDTLKNVQSETYHTYAFGDGWVASVSVKEIEGKDAPKFKRRSAGFNGYDWMVYEIEQYGRIRFYEERHPTE